jgi:hypothetical protein
MWGVRGLLPLEVRFAAGLHRQNLLPMWQAQTLIEQGRTKRPSVTNTISILFHTLVTTEIEQELERHCITKTRQKLPKDRRQSNISTLSESYVCFIPSSSLLSIQVGGL